MTSNLMTVAEVAAYLRYTGKRPDVSALRWLRRHDVRMVNRGACWLVRKTDVEAVLEQSTTGDTVTRARYAESLPPVRAPRPVRPLGAVPAPTGDSALPRVAAGGRS